MIILAIRVIFPSKMIYFIYFIRYWILNISYANFHYNLTKQSYENTPLKKGVLSRKNYLKVKQQFCRIKTRLQDNILICQKCYSIQHVALVYVGVSMT